MCSGGEKVYSLGIFFQLYFWCVLWKLQNRVGQIHIQQQYDQYISNTNSNTIQASFMSQQQSLHQQLQITRQSFQKLQTNFNHNLKVIEELESLVEDYERQKAIQDQELDEILIRQQKYQEEIEQLKNQNEQLYAQAQQKLNMAKLEGEEELQNVIEMMNEKLRNERKNDKNRISREMQEHRKQCEKYEQTIKYYSLENAKLAQALKTLKLQKQQHQYSLSNNQQQKQHLLNKLSLHEKQLENIRQTNTEWQQLLKQKISDLQKQKNSIQEELTNYKLTTKLKLKNLKEEYMRKIEEVTKDKDNQMRSIVQDSKEIKIKYDDVCREIDRVKSQNRSLEKNNGALENNVKQLENKACSLKEVEQNVKILQQELKYVKNEVVMLNQEKKELKEEFAESNNKREEAEKTIQRLKTALMTSEKSNSEMTNKIKKMQRQIKQAYYAKKKSVTNHVREDNTTQVYLNLEDKFDKIQEKQERDDVDYSKYFSEDMGPIDDNYFGGGGMLSSVPRSPKMKQTVAGGPNHQLMKKIGELQVEIDQYKNIIKTMSQDLQRVEQSHSHKLQLKDHEIKLSKEQIYFLREKINEKQHQILNLTKTVNQQAHLKDDMLKKNNQLIEMKNSEIKMKNSIQLLEKERSGNLEKNQELEEKCRIMEMEMKVLENVNEDLRSEVYQLKNRVKVYDEEEEEDSEFQEISYDETQQRLQQVHSKHQKLEKTRNNKKERSKSHSKSRSKSGKRNTRFSNPSTIVKPAPKNSMKLRDLVLAKRELQMKGVRANIEVREQDAYRGIEKKGTQSQKTALEALKRQAKEREVMEVQNRRPINFGYLANQPNNE